MTYASRLVLLLGLAMIVVSPNPASAQQPMTPQEVCAELPDSARIDCIAAGELLAAASRASPGDDDLTVLMTADKGGLTLEYRKPGERPGDDPSVQCTVGDRITLPVGKVVRLQFTSADVIYDFEVPGHIEKVDLVPGRVNERRIETPAEAGQAGGVLQTDGNGPKKIVAVRFYSGQSAFDGRMLCAG